MTARPCVRCGSPIVGRIASAIYCTDRCKNWSHRKPGTTPPPPVELTRGCGTCGLSLEARHRNARFCSDHCRYRFAHPEPVAVVTPCNVCGEPARRAGALFCSGRCEQWRRRHPGEVWPTGRTCGNCGIPIDHLHPHAKWCGDACMGAANAHVRRARLLTLPSESIRKADVFARDGWRCHLCHKRIDKRLRHPHPLSASLDHIIPLALPGSPGHVLSNVAASHLTCNLSKNTRPMGEQLRLIG